MLPLRGSGQIRMDTFLGPQMPTPAFPVNTPAVSSLLTLSPSLSRACSDLNINGAVEGVVSCAHFCFLTGHQVGTSSVTRPSTLLQVERVSPGLHPPSSHWMFNTWSLGCG